MIPPEIWPVIHIKSGPQVESIKSTLQNAQIAFQAKVHGLFLISMHGEDTKLTEHIKAVQTYWPKRKIGVNHLTYSGQKSLEKNLQQGVAATWTDQTIPSTHLPEKALAIQTILQENPDHLFFGAIAFKYQAPEPNPGKAALNALALNQIPTTSGEGTGIAADLSKLQTIRQAIGPSNPLGIASGVTPENVQDHLGLVSHILVATGISTAEDNLCPEKLHRLIKNLS